RFELRGDELLGERAAARCRCAALQEIGREEPEIGVYLADRHHGRYGLLGSRGGGNKNQRQAGDGRMTGDGHDRVSSDWWEHCILLQINYPPEGADVSASRVIPRSRGTRAVCHTEGHGFTGATKLIRTEALRSSGRAPDRSDGCRARLDAVQAVRAGPIFRTERACASRGGLRLRAFLPGPSAHA